MLKAFTDGAHPERVILTDDPLRAKMLAAHHLEYAALIFEQGDVLVYFGSYNGTAMALVAVGFERGAVLDFVREAGAYGVAEVLYIGACVGISARQPLRTVVLAAGGSRRLLDRARAAARLHNIPVVTGTVVPAGGGDMVYDGVIDDAAAALYGQARIGGVDALSILTVSENAMTGEKMEEHELRSRFYAAARLVFETFAYSPDEKGDNG